MTTQQHTYRNSTGLIITLAVTGLFIFLPVWINVYIAPIYLIVHGLLVLGLLSIKTFQSTIKPLKFGLIISGIPLGLLLIQNIFTIPLYISTDSNLGEIVVVTGLTFIVCLVDFVTTYFIYNYWWSKKRG
jgi:hypothetical protein